MSAVTADVVAVDLIANDNRYTANIGRARREMLGFASDTEKSMRRVDSSTGAALRNSSSNAALLAGSLSQIKAYLSIGAVVAFAKSLIDMGDALSDMAAQLGITTQELQGLDYAARVSGASSERLQQALSFLTDSLGDAQKGEGELAKFMRANRIEMGSTLDVLYNIADRVKNATSAQEKMSIATTALGRSGRTMVSFLNQGADGLRRLQAEAARKGQIWDPQTVAKLNDAKDSFETLEKALVNIAAVPASAFINDLAELLNSIASGNWQAGIDKLARLMPVIAGVALGGLVGGIPGALLGGAAGIGVESLLPGDKTSDARQSAPGKAGRSKVPLSKEQAQQAAKERADILNVLAEREADVLKASSEASEARRDAIRQDDQGILELRKTYADFYSWQQDIIQETARLDISSVNDRTAAELAALSAKQKADEARLTQLHASTAQMKNLDQGYADQRVDIATKAAQQILQIETKKDQDFAQAEEDWNQSHAKAVQFSDTLRGALESVGLAARKGFGSLKDAANSALDAIEQMALQVYVLKPLLDSLFGKEGTTGGGLLGGLLSDIGIPGFGGGTNDAPGGLAWVGDKGRELVNLPKGSKVTPAYALPTVPSMTGRGGATIYAPSYIYADRSILADDILNKIQDSHRQAVSEAVAASLGAQPDRARSYAALGT